jgi:N-acyl homoserine lactone hydrolase
VTRAAPRLRLFVLDGGTIEHMDPARFGLKPDEVDIDHLSVEAYLIAHPDGLLVFDTGAVPDADWAPTGGPVAHHLVLPDGEERDVTLRRRIGAQLAEAGFAPADVTHLAVSHHHYDHTANVGLFPGATWLVGKAERDVMFRSRRPVLTRPTDYEGLREASTTLIATDEHDVFGDGTVVIKAAPGHTPGHQILLVRLAKTGPVVLSGDLYHLPQERALDRMPTFEADPRLSRRSRREIDGWLESHGATLWIGHDATASAGRRKAPDHYA